jgi:hypothetical protein
MGRGCMARLAIVIGLPRGLKHNTLLRDYVDVRLEGVESGIAVPALARSEELQGRLWGQAVLAAEKNPTPITSLFVQSVNEVINLHAKRLTMGMRNRIPTPIWWALYFTAILAMVGVGYYEGLTSATRSLETLVLVVTFSGILGLLADLDRPQEG